MAGPRKFSSVLRICHRQMRREHVEACKLLEKLRICFALIIFKGPNKVNKHERPLSPSEIQIALPGCFLRICLLRVLSATFILSKNSRVLDAKSRQKSANLG